MTKKQRLHKELLEVTLPHTYQRMIGHALIDLGRITAIECVYEDCCGETREFWPREKDTKAGRFHCAIDHIDEDGNDLPENLQLIHFSCNVRKARRFYKDSPQRGDQHWSRRHPEKVRRGPEHYAFVGETTKTCANPECGKQFTVAHKKRHQKYCSQSCWYGS